MATVKRGSAKKSAKKKKSGDTGAGSKAAPDKKATDLRGKIKSDFPKHTLIDALRVPQVLEDKNGGRGMPPTEVAIGLGMSPGSSEFRQLLSSSLKYGLTSGSFAAEKIAITSLGSEIAAPTSHEAGAAAKVKAFLTPPTFSTMYEQLKGKKLPQGVFFENSLVRDFDVPREHASKCVEIFTANVKDTGLERAASTGVWLASDGVPTVVAEVTEEDEREDPIVPPIDHAPPVVPVVPSATERRAIFLGHGKNKKPLEELKQVLSDYKIPFKIAVDEPNRFRPISEKVAETMNECGAAILIFTADEKFFDEAGSEIWKPNENVVYELGAASMLYGKRVVIFKERDVSFPSNFRDIGHIEFEKDRLSAKAIDLFRELVAFGLVKISVGG